MNTSIEEIDLSTTLKSLYKKWPEIRRFLKSVGCDAVHAEDIFQEALLIYMRKIEDPTFQLTVEPFFYVKNTCKFLWYNQARKEGKNVHIELPENIEEYQDDWFSKELKLQLVERAIDQIGAQCQQLLQLFYGLGLSLVEIAKKLSMRNEGVARTQKYRCLNKVKDIVRTNTIHR